jgi:hypothetical protein
MTKEPNGTRKTTRLIVHVAFSGESADRNVDGAAAKLQKGGYKVHCMPERYRRYLVNSRDDYLEVIIAVRDEEDAVTIMEKLNAIVEPFGLLCRKCGPVTPGYKPFQRLPSRVLQLVRAFANLERKGLICDSGRRRNGQVVWVARSVRDQELAAAQAEHEAECERVGQEHELDGLRSRGAE